MLLFTIKAKYYHLKEVVIIHSGLEQLYIWRVADVADKSDANTFSDWVGNDIVTAYDYSDPRKNLRTQIRNEFKGNLISQYDCKYDEFGQRISVTNTGPAFASPAGAFNI